MIEGFEEFTKNVKEHEIPTVKLIAKGLNGRIGIKNAIKSSEICDALLIHSGIKINDAKLRRYVQYIRAYGLCSMLCGSKKGYYIAENKEEWIKYREAFRTRITSMTFTMLCMDNDVITSNVLNQNQQ